MWKNRSAMRTCVAYELPWSQRFFLPLRGSGSLILCREKSRKSSGTLVLNSPFFTYHWNSVDFPVCRFGCKKMIITRLVQVWILKKLLGKSDKLQGSNLWWTRGSRNTSSRPATETGISSGCYEPFGSKASLFNSRRAGLISIVRTYILFGANFTI